MIKDNDLNQANNSWFRKLDDAIASGLIAIQESKVYPHLIYFLDNFDDDIKKFIGQLAGLIIIFFPIILCFMLVFSNMYKRKNIEINREILKISKDYSIKKRNIAPVFEKLISAQEIAGQEQFVSIIREAASTNGISGETLKIDNFTQEDASGNTIKTQAHATFSNVVLADLMGAMRALSEKSQIRVIDIKMEKNEESKLSGFINIVHYAKASAAAVPRDKKGP